MNKRISKNNAENDMILDVERKLSNTAAPDVAIAFLRIARAKFKLLTDRCFGKRT